MTETPDLLNDMRKLYAERAAALAAKAEADAVLRKVNKPIKAFEDTLIDTAEEVLGAEDVSVWDGSDPNRIHVVFTIEQMMALVERLG